MVLDTNFYAQDSPPVIMLRYLFGDYKPGVRKYFAETGYVVHHLGNDRKVYINVRYIGLCLLRSIFPKDVRQIIVQSIVADK